MISALPHTISVAQSNILFYFNFPSKEEAQTKSRRKVYPRQFVKIPSEFENLVKGKGGDNLHNICTVTGAKVLSRGNNSFELKGKKKNVQHAELLMKRRVVCTHLIVFHKKLLILSPGKND